MRRSLGATTVIGIVLVLIFAIFLIFLLQKFLFVLNYKGRLSCKAAYSLGSVVTSVMSKDDLAKLALDVGVVTGLGVGYKSLSTLSKKYLYYRYGGDVYEVVSNDIEESSRLLLKEEPEILKVFSEDSKVGAGIVALATLLGLATGYEVSTQINSISLPIEKFAESFIPKILSVCKPSPEDIKPPISYMDNKNGGYKCSAMDNFFKGILFPKYYKKLKQLLGNCATNKAKWEAAFNDAYIAYYAMITYDEDLEGVNVGVPVVHYNLLLDDPKISYKYGEGDVVCWWKMIKYSSDKSYYEIIYDKNKKEYIPISPTAYDGDSICWKVLEKVEHKNKSDILQELLTDSSDNSRDALFVFADPNFCKNHPNAYVCNPSSSSTSYVENYINWGKTNNIGVFVEVGAGLGRVFVIFDYLTNSSS